MGVRKSGKRFVVTFALSKIAGTSTSEAARFALSESIKLFSDRCADEGFDCKDITLRKAPKRKLSSGLI